MLDIEIAMMRNEIGGAKKKISKKESSFFEKKEAKKLCPDILAPGPGDKGKSFLLLFFKKEDSYFFPSFRLGRQESLRLPRHRP